MRGDGRRAGLDDVGADPLCRLEVEIGALQRHLAVGRLDQHVGEDGNGVALLDDAMHVSQSLEQDRTLDGDFHRKYSEFSISQGAMARLAGSAEFAKALKGAQGRAAKSVAGFPRGGDWGDFGENFTGP